MSTNNSNMITPLPLLALASSHSVSNQGDAQKENPVVESLGCNDPEGHKGPLQESCSLDGGTRGTKRFDFSDLVCAYLRLVIYVLY